MNVDTQLHEKFQYKVIKILGITFAAQIYVVVDQFVHDIRAMM